MSPSKSERGVPHHLHHSVLQSHWAEETSAERGVDSVMETAAVPTPFSDPPPTNNSELCHVTSFGQKHSSMATVNRHLPSLLLPGNPGTTTMCMSAGWPAGG